MKLTTENTVSVEGEERRRWEISGTIKCRKPRKEFNCKKTTLSISELKLLVRGMLYARVKLCSLCHGFRQHIYRKSLHLLQLKTFWCLLDYSQINSRLEKLKIVKIPVQTGIFVLIKPSMSWISHKGELKCVWGPHCLIMVFLYHTEVNFDAKKILSQCVTIISYVSQY